MKIKTTLLFDFEDSDLSVAEVYDRVFLFRGHAIHTWHNNRYVEAYVDKVIQVEQVDDD